MNLGAYWVVGGDVLSDMNLAKLMKHNMFGISRLHLKVFPSALSPSARYVRSRSAISSPHCAIVPLSSFADSLRVKFPLFIYLQGQKEIHL